MVSVRGSDSRGALVKARAATINRTARLRLFRVNRLTRRNFIKRARAPLITQRRKCVWPVNKWKLLGCRIYRIEGGWLVGWLAKRERKREKLYNPRSNVLVPVRPFFSIFFSKGGLFDKVCAVIKEKEIEISFRLKRKKSIRKRSCCMTQSTEAIRSSPFTILH